MMEEKTAQEMCETEFVVENGVVTLTSTAEDTEEGEATSEEAVAGLQIEVPTDCAIQATDGQLTDTVTETCDQAENSQTIGLLQAEYDALSAAFPGELPFTHLADMPRLGAFLTLRDKGLSPREAYLAIEGERRSTASGISHLRAAAPRVAVPVAPTLLSRETLAEWRRLFPHLSDREIGELYRRTATNET